MHDVHVHCVHVHHVHVLLRNINKNCVLGWVVYWYLVIYSVHCTSTLIHIYMYMYNGLVN